MITRRRRVYQAILTFIFVVVLLFLVCVGGNIPARAYAASPNALKYDQTNVLDDLENSTIDGVPFDISNYTFDENQPAQVFMFAEYCYSFYTNLRDNYGLYVYVYNPQRLKFKTNSMLNTISIRAGNDDSIGHTKYTLLYLNQCEISN